MSSRRSARLIVALVAPCVAAATAAAAPPPAHHPHHTVAPTVATHHPTGQHPSGAHAPKPAHGGHPAAHPASRSPGHPPAHPAARVTSRAPHHATPAKAATAAAAAAAAATAATAAQTPPAAPSDDKGSVTGLPLPRFAALRAEEVNLRSGPGTRYPIQWVYHRRDLPVRVEREFDVWRLIEDMDGVKGWVNQAILVGSRGFVATAPLALLRDGPARDGAVVAAVRAGVVGRLLRCAAPPPGTPPEPLAGPEGVLAGAADSAPVGPPAAPGSTVDPRADANAAPPAPSSGEPAAEAAKPPAPAPKSSAPVVTDLAGADAVVAEAVAQARSGATHPAPADAQPGWCQVRIRDYTGWLPRDALYGVLPGEVIAPS